jgi:hypothetical protein
MRIKKSEYIWLIFFLQLLNCSIVLLFSRSEVEVMLKYILSTLPKTAYSLSYGREIMVCRDSGEGDQNWTFPQAEEYIQTEVTF